MTDNKLQTESIQATQLLEGKKVKAVIRNSPHEVIIEFADGSRFFADTKEGEIELSIT